ncbi:MAG: TetR/AcrR family transcriptional regulator [Chloroflexaceae bacterium]
MHSPAGLTPKGERTREHILDTALTLFIQKGYHTTTMRDIAASAECSIGLTYRYFARKEDLVLALYRRMAQDLATQVDMLPAAPLANRFEQIMRFRIGQMQPYRELFRAILGASMSPENELGVLGTQTADVRAQSGDAFVALVAGATDAPPEEALRDVAVVLYAAQLGMLLFWMYDGTPGHRATEQLLAFARDMLRLGRRLLRLSPVANAFARLARTIEPVLGPWE